VFIEVILPGQYYAPHVSSNIYLDIFIWPTYYAPFVVWSSKVYLNTFFWPSLCFLWQKKF
jgi:hypothetical protein